MRKFTLVVLCTLSALFMSARDISQTEALKIAKSFLSGKAALHGGESTGGKDKTRASATAMKLAFTAKSAKGLNDFYVFNADNTGGFVIVSADDRAGQILGYADSGSFDYSTMPADAKNWMQGYADQIEYIRANNIEVTAAETTAYPAPVSPILAGVFWNQDSPYNDQCPVYDISSRCATGCVATAMAQVMFANQWPVTGTGTKTYSPSILGGGTLSADFGSTTYEWEKMLPAYDSNSSKESREAVAKLMLHCGIAVDMEYSSSSGAASLPIPYAFYNYFNYDCGVAYRQRSNYSSEEWQEVIINELDHNRPVVATGSSSAGGHCFVFDGYDADGLIHVNWGWGGMSNGYFRTSALMPSSQGIGGADGGFNYNQQIITGIQRPQGDTEPDIELVSTEGLSVTGNTIDNGGTFSIRLNGMVYNAGWQDASFEYGLMLRDTEGNFVKSIATGVTDELYVNYENDAPYLGEVSLGQLAEGSYRLYPVCRNVDGKGTWFRVRDEYVGYPNYINIEVKDGKMTFTYPGYFDLKAEYKDAPEYIYASMVSKVSATVTNQGDVNFLGNVALALVNKTTGRNVLKGDAYKIDLAPGASIELEMLSSFAAEPGEYLLTMIDDDDRHIAPLREITVRESPAATPAFEAAEPLAVDNAENVDPLNISMTAKIRCTQGTFGGYAYLFILNESGAVQKGTLDPQYVFFEEGTTADVSFTGRFENATPGTRYQACLILNDGSYSYFLSNSREQSTCYFSIAGTSSVDNAAADAVQKCEVYDLNGRRMPSGKTLDRGLYIMKKDGKTYKIAK